MMSDENNAALKRRETGRRLQIAAIGLFAVILVGSLGRIMIDKADKETAAEEIDMGEGEQPTNAEAAPPAGSDEPLAELGVQPTLEKPPEEQNPLNAQ